MLSLPNKSPTPMSEIFPSFKEEKNGLDLLQRMLDFHPGRRITVEEALAHPYLSSLHNIDDEPLSNFTFSFDFEHEDLPRERVQDLIWEEIKAYHPDIPEFNPSKRKNTKSEDKKESK